jgi:hypothetical protein
VLQHEVYGRAVALAFDGEVPRCALRCGALALGADAGDVGISQDAWTRRTGAAHAPVVCA